VGRVLGDGAGRGVTTGVTVGVALGVGLPVGVGVGVGVGPPPFAVHRIVPLSPTAIPRNASFAKETSLRLAEVPLAWSVQAIPIFVVCRIRPPQPTANPKFDVFVTGKSRPSIG
jgi:hypothetical protein